MKEFKLPELGENIESADVVSVLVKPGDKIQKEQSVIEIETDKATIEVPSTVEGVIKEVLVKTGDSVKVGQTILKVEDTAEQKKPAEKPKEEEKSTKEDKSSPKTETPKRKSTKSGIYEFKLPELGENIESADVVSVLVKTGDVIEKDQSVIEIETDKATIEVPSPVSGKVTELLVKPGDKAKVGEVILKLEPSEEIEQVPEKEKITEVTEERPAEQTPQTTATEIPKGEVVELLPGEEDRQPPITKGAAPAAPSVRRLAREIGVDINEVKGTGPGGRISMDDVKAYSKKLHQERKSGAGIGIPKEPLPDFSKFGEIEKVKMSKIREVTATHLSYAWATIPHVTQFDKADITLLEKTRKELNKKIEGSGAKITVTSILLKVITGALKKFPQFNSSIDMETKEIIYKKYFNIGVAVDTEHGLIVPVIKNVDNKNLTELSIELAELAQKARDKKISLDELQGGCFTITNLGGIGGTSFTPVVNSPEVAILGVSRGSYEPVYNGYGVFEPRLMLPLSLSYDHRIIDGADAVRFLRWVIEALEQPLNLIL